MSILSIPLGVIAIAIFVWAINSDNSKKDSSKKKDNDSMIIGIIVSVVLFAIAVGIYDSESTGGLFGSDSNQQAAQEHRMAVKAKNAAQQEVEEANKAAVEKAAKNAKDNANQSNNNDKQNKESATSAVDSSKVEKTTDKSDEKQNENLEKQREAYKNWFAQIDAKIQSTDTTWSALWTEHSPESVEKLIKALETEKSALEAIKMPSELSAQHRQRLNEAVKRYGEWIESRRKVCQMNQNKSSDSDITNELARGDGLKIQSKIEIANVGRELGM